MKYIKQLDSIRAIAVILVIISHWLPKTNVLNIIPNGNIGVDIFFVLSGFLITKILFDIRSKAEVLNIPKAILIKNFYVRRTLRIFPIYYLTILVLLLFSKNTGTDIHSAFIYLITYTSNLYFFNIQKWGSLHISIKNIINVYLNTLLPNLFYKKYWVQLFVFENTILLIAIS